MNEIYNKLYIACSYGNINEVKEYLELGNYINGLDESESQNRLMPPPLFGALESKNKDVAIYLLKNGADPNISFKRGLIKSSILENLIEAERGIAEQEAEIPENEDIAESNVLEILKDTSMLELLISYKPDINKPDEEGYTSLDKAYEIHHESAYKLLKEKGAKHSKRFVETSHKGYDLANSKIDYIDIPYIDKTLPHIHQEIKRILRNHNELNRPLNLGFLEDIVKKEKNINVEDWKKRTPLDFAIELGHNLAVDYLRIHGGKTSKELEEENK